MQCKVCKRSAHDSDVPFYFQDDKWWCERHVPREVKRAIDGWAK